MVAETPRRIRSKVHDIPTVYLWPNGYCHFFLFSDTACAVEITTEDDLDGVCEDVSGIQSFREIVFHVNEKHLISYYISRDPDESKPQQYDNTTIRVAGNPIRVDPKLPVIAAVAYSDPKTCCDYGELGQDEVRLYYVEPDTRLVKEIRRSGPSSKDTWEFGKEFNSKGFDIDERSGLSTNVARVGGGFQLKVYLQKHPDELSVAYRVLEALHEDWSDRTDIAN
ncbi:unnamed protein product [Clonostachys rosea f. rosea IK726]|uniref:Uncharacterized protein n=1 Tax=Clonostachys rosea f. rosea IK726 TaxID=1349383 RepID=A0ACA9UTS9_BIOOC|nr:unnamed protein product [Clonostachys rosea f. rosea IK726]